MPCSSSVTGGYLRVEQEAAGTGHWRGCGRACYRHGNSLADHAVPLTLCFFSAAPHNYPLGTTWSTPLVMGL